MGTAMPLQRTQPGALRSVREGNHCRGYQHTIPSLPSLPGTVGIAIGTQETQAAATALNSLDAMGESIRLVLNE